MWIDILTIAGLVIAIVQIVRTGRIAKATKKSVESATRQIGVYTLFASVPELTLVEHQLNHAAESGDPGETKRILREWQSRASELRGLLRTEPVEGGELAELVQDSITLATRARVNIDKGKDIVVATAAVRESCERVCLSARSIAAQIQSSPPSAEQEDPEWTIRGFLASRADREKGES